VWLIFPRSSNFEPSAQGVLTFEPKHPSFFPLYANGTVSAFFLMFSQMSEALGKHVWQHPPCDGSVHQALLGVSPGMSILVVPRASPLFSIVSSLFEVFFARHPAPRLLASELAPGPNSKLESLYRSVFPFPVHLCKPSSVVPSLWLPLPRDSPPPCHKAVAHGLTP